MNKRVLTSLITALISYLCSIAMAQRIKGSDTTLPLTQAWAEAYLAETGKHEEILAITGGGSGVGLAALRDNNTEIAMSSRQIKREEKEFLRNKNMQLVEMIVAYDALAIVVNPHNPIKKLTRKQLELIFRGKVRNWKDFGGEDLQIVVYTRESSSGTYDFFLQKVLHWRNFTPRALSMPATGAIVESIGQTPGAIGYVGASYIGHLKPIAVSFDHGEHYYLPNTTDIESGNYPIVRPLYYYFDKKDEAKLQPFLDFIRSNEGREITKKLGYFPTE